MKAFRIKLLKKISVIAAATIGMAAFQTTHAAQFNQIGRVGNLNVIDSGNPGFIGGNNFSMVGIASLGSCNTFLGVVPFVVKDDLRGQQMLAAILAAATSGSTIGVTVDDTVRNGNGYCFVLNVSIVGN